MKQRTVFIFCLVFYIVTRIYIWVAGPKEFSQITSVYMPYAHLWDSGIKPYLQQWYEYPPVTIPLFYLPHLVDKSTMDFSWHVNYGQVYRSLILVIDISLWILIWRTLLKFKSTPSVLTGALLYYIMATTKAHDFIYDAMDLVFVAAIAFGIMAPKFLKKYGYFFSWLGYFIAIGLKLINIPLGVIYAVLERKNVRKLWLNILLAGILVWLIPVLVYRSSLSVMLVYHSQRGLQVESVPAQLAAMANQYTHTEKYEVLYQSMNITGPISTQFTTIFNILLIIAVLVYLIWGVKTAFILPGSKQTEAKLAFTLGYIFCFMFFGKILSTPYLLWQIPLLALYPYKNLKEQLLLTVPSFVMIVISMTKIPNIEFGVFNLHLLIGITRSTIIAYLLWQSVKLIRKLEPGTE